MLFDRLVGLLERGKIEHPLVEAMASRARLFEFPAYAHEALPKEFTEDQIESLQEMFMLPFPIVAMEDPGSCVLLMSCFELRDIIKASPKFLARAPWFSAYMDGIHEAWEHKYSKGISKPYFTLEVLPLDKIDEAAYNFDTLTYGEPGHGSKTRTINKINHPDIGFRTLLILSEMSGAVLGSSTVDYRFSIMDIWGVPDNNEPLMSVKDIFGHNEDMIHSAGQNAMTALEEVMFFQAPDRFIVEVRDLHTKLAKKGHLPRSHQRPRYICLKPKDIRDKISLGGTHASPHIHERRAHARKLRSEYYKNKRGQVIWVPAVWVGKNEGGDGRRWYKVMLDK